MVDPVRGPVLQPFGGHPGRVLAVAVTPDGEEIITVGDGATAAWWEQLGRAAYPGAKTLTITADSDGSNSARQ